MRLSIPRFLSAELGWSWIWSCSGLVVTRSFTTHIMNVISLSFTCVTFLPNPTVTTVNDNTECWADFVCILNVTQMISFKKIRCDPLTTILYFLEVLFRLVTPFLTCILISTGSKPWGRAFFRCVLQVHEPDCTHLLAIVGACHLHGEWHQPTSLYPVLFASVEPIFKMDSTNW